jgi:hypothetical protein
MNSRIENSPQFRNVLRPSAAMLMVCLGCGGQPSTTVPIVSPTFASIWQNIFAVSCQFAACHGDRSNLPLHLGSASALQSIVGVNSTQVPGMLRVKPGDAGGSYLYLKVSQAHPPVGERMPPGQPLEPEMIDAIRAWIEMGAKQP